MVSCGVVKIGCGVVEASCGIVVAGFGAVVKGVVVRFEIDCEVVGKRRVVDNFENVADCVFSGSMVANFVVSVGVTGFVVFALTELAVEMVGKKEVEFVAGIAVVE